MKKALKKVLILVVIIVANLVMLINTVQAVENGTEIAIYTKGYFNKIIKKGEITVKTAHAVYQENGKEYPVYCLNKELHGVGDYIATYNVKNQGKIDDLGLWRVIINGYPYKTPNQLGTANEEEAYTATKQAIYCYIYNTSTELYSAIGEPGVRVINAMNTILENAKNSTETFESPSIEIIQSENWEVDTIENEYVSKEYEIKSNKNISQIILNLESQPEGTKITNLSNNKFKILIPIKNLKESGEFKIKIKTPIETKPILFGKAPNSDLQDYALTAFSYEDIDSELVQNYEKNNTKIIIEKKDKETKESLKGAKFEVLDKNLKVIQVTETNKEGKIIINNLLPGTYYIREIKAPEGYTLDEKMKKIDIKMNEELLVEVKNEKNIVNEEVPKLPITGM